MRYVVLIILLLSAAGSAKAVEPALLDLESSASTGQVFLTFEQLPVEYLYVPALESGVGSNDLELDRGQLDRTRLVRFERFGNKVLLIEPNLEFRADSNNVNERRAVEQAFASSVLAGFEIQESEGSGTRVDLTPFLLSDVARITSRIAAMEQGNFSVDASRSAVDVDAIRNFPRNTLIPSVMTLAGADPGQFIKDVTPTPDSLTLRVSHQFIALPEPGYQPRKFHPRSGYFDLSYYDYAAPLESPMQQRLIYRHRLKPGQTLIYYVDNGTPEPVRSALLEGASWWEDAFAAAGLEDTFKVEVLPQGADPLDIRYNVIQWVHRSTRGWSYGGSVADPRTGEIIKGHVSLGSLRVRQDQLIAEALTAPFTETQNSSTAARDMALARLRQLSAHEVGHTLGLDHNFAASSSGDASVMDYPHPNLYLDKNGAVRLDQAYSTGVSDWDRLTVRYGYSTFPAGQEPEGLASILNEARVKGIAFIGDQDARVAGAAHPGAHLWDNGSDVLARLDELLAIRQAGLDRFSPAVINNGTPLFEMERRLVPVYLLHRYQLQAAAKLIGGVYYDYGLKGEEAAPLQAVSAEVQGQALSTVLALLEPEQLALPSSLQKLIPPPAIHQQRDREFFQGATGAPFDHLAPARAGADLVLSELLQPARLARLNDQHALDASLPAAADVFDLLLKLAWNPAQEKDLYLDAIQTEVDWLTLRAFMTLAADQSAPDTVRALGTNALLVLESRLGSKTWRDSPQGRAARQEIRNYLAHPQKETPEKPLTVPPGSPIGG